MTESPKFSGGVTPKVSLLANGVFAKVEALMNQIYAILQENHEALIRSVPGGRRFSEVAFFGSCLLDDGVDPVVKNIEVCTESQEFITVLNLVSTMSVEGRLRVARSIFKLFGGMSDEQAEELPWVDTNTENARVFSTEQRLDTFTTPN